MGVGRAGGEVGVVGAGVGRAGGEVGVVGVGVGRAGGEVGVVGEVGAGAGAGGRTAAVTLTGTLPDFEGSA